MSEDKTIIEYLKQFSNKTVIYVPNLGNAGDGLIASATYEIFKELNINYKFATFDELIPRDKTVVYGGGGALIEQSIDNIARKFIKRIHNDVQKLVILPHTINGNKDLLSELSDNVDIICRERTSYEYVNDIAQNANVYLMHDMAFSINPSMLLKNYNKFKKKRYMSMLSSSLTKKIAKNYLDDIKLKYLYYSTKLTSFNFLNCFRTDKEMTNLTIPRNNIDIAKIFSVDTNKSPLIAYYESSLLFNFLNNFEKIRTNRLHTCIAGALLHKKVDFYPNNYYKNFAVYKHSIEGFFPDIYWCSQMQ